VKRNGFSCFAFAYFFIKNRSVLRLQGGYFFIFLMTSLKATKTIARTNKYVISAIGIHPLSQGSRNSRHRSFTNIIIAYLFTLNKYQYVQIIRLNIVV